MQLIHGDCLEKMKDIPDKSIDMILCDLPYGTTACKWDVVIPFNKYVQIGEKVIYEQEYVFDKMKSGVSYKEALEDFLSISKDGLWDNYNRVIKDRGCIALFGSEPFSSHLRMSNIKNYKYDWIWEKDKPNNFALANKQPMKYHENILVFYEKQPTFNKQLEPRKGGGKSRFKYPVDNSKRKSEHNNIQDDAKMFNPDLKNPSSIQFISTGRRQDLIHPTQKPVALLEYLIKTYTLEGETVLDNCAGSGSTGVACLNTNRNFIGIEKDDKYFEIAKKRIEEHLTTAST